MQYSIACPCHFEQGGANTLQQLQYVAVRHNGVKGNGYGRELAGLQGYHYVPKYNERLYSIMMYKRSLYFGSEWLLLSDDW